MSAPLHHDQELPFELVEQIFLHLPPSDLVRLTTLSSSYHDLIHNSHVLWSHHLRKSGLFGLSSDTPDSLNNLEKFKRRFLYIKDLKRFLERLSHDYIFRLSSLVEIDLEQDQLVSCLMDPEKRETAYRYLSGLLLSSCKFTNLTYKLYGRYFLIALSQLRIIEDLMGCLQSGSVFDGSLLISRWVGASLGESSIIHNIKPTECAPVKEFIEGLVTLCRNRLSPFLTIEDVLNVIKEVLFQDLGLEYVQSESDGINIDYFRMDKVLHKSVGYPTIFTILFQEVGSRLGLTLNLIKVRRRLVLSFEGSDGATKYIDCFDSGKILSRSQCLQLRTDFDIRGEDNYFQPVTPVQFLVKLTSHIITLTREAIIDEDRARLPYKRYFFAMSMYKLMYYLSPGKYSAFAGAVHYSRRFNIKFNFIKKFSCISPDGWSTYCREMSECAKQVKEWMFEKKSKPRHIKFSIGLVMKHWRKNYTCVIYGWDERCMMTEEWQDEHDISTLEFKGNQPFYRVLVGHDTDSTQYVAQEDLMLTRSVFVIHEDVGKYFSQYNGFKFVPNSALRSIYSYLKKN